MSGSFRSSGSANVDFRWFHVCATPVDDAAAGRRMSSTGSMFLSRRSPRIPTPGMSSVRFLVRGTPVTSSCEHECHRFHVRHAPCIAQMVQRMVSSVRFHVRIKLCNNTAADGRMRSIGSMVVPRHRRLLLRLIPRVSFLGSTFVSRQVAVFGSHRG